MGVGKPDATGTDAQRDRILRGLGYSVGNGGAALATADAGHKWIGLTTVTSVNLTRVQALAPSTVIVGGAGDSGRPVEGSTPLKAVVR
jgi:photosystem II stability/assembly factor-like uncharacterized protein